MQRVSFESFVRLGWAFARVMAGKLRGARGQLARFVGQYASDGIVLFAPEDRAVLAGAARCIACARCDTAALESDSFTALGPRGPMAFVLGVSRHSGEHDTEQLSPAATESLLEALTDACPVRVPFVPLVDLVRRRAEAQRVGRDQPAARSASPSRAPV